MNRRVRKMADEIRRQVMEGTERALITAIEQIDGTVPSGLEVARFGESRTVAGKEGTHWYWRGEYLFTVMPWVPDEPWIVRADPDLG